MSYKKLINRIGLALFEELPYLTLNIPKPQIKNSGAADSLKAKNFHFQYAFGIPGVNQDFVNPRYENMLVTEDIAKEIKKFSKSRKEISVCESAPLDGYIIWRLSQLQKKKEFNLHLSALEIQENNCRKIELVGDVFGYQVNTYNLPIEQFNDGVFDFFTMLGVSYQLPQPLKTLEHIISNLLKPDSFFYFDFIHPYDNFSKYGFHDNGSTDEEGYNGQKFILADERTAEDNAYYLNHPTSAVSTILYRKEVLDKFLSSFKNIQLQPVFRSGSSTYEMVTYRAHIQNN